VHKIELFCSITARTMAQTLPPRSLRRFNRYSEWTGRLSASVLSPSRWRSRLDRLSSVPTYSRALIRISVFLRRRAEAFGACGTVVGTKDSDFNRLYHHFCRLFCDSSNPFFTPSVPEVTRQPFSCQLIQVAL